MIKLGNKKIYLLLLILGMAIGFSYLTTGFTIKGNTEVSGNSWDIHFQNIQVLHGNENSSLPTIDTNKTKVNFAVELEKPGDYYEFTVDVINNGTIDAKVDSIIKSNYNENISKLLDYTVFYLNGSEINKDDILQVHESTTYKVVVEYKKDISSSDLSSTDIDLNLSFEVNYVQCTTNILNYGQIWDYDYTGGEQSLILPASGVYQLNVWGAQGGTANGKTGGYGGYSTGKITLQKGKTIYINVGGKGSGGGAGTSYAGGYNGGGSGYGGTCGSVRYGASGGGATHIALISGKLSTIGYEQKEKILIVSGGGGGGHNMYAAYGNGAHAGGYIGNSSSWTNVSHNYTVSATGGSQTQSGTTGYGYSAVTSSTSGFGQGGNIGASCAEGSGGGGGFYGGGAGQFSPGAGGSGYIANSLLSDKVMYCYNCQTSNQESTKTITTTNVSSNAISNYAKQENGYATVIYNPETDILFGNFKKTTNSVNFANIDFNSKTGEISFNTTISSTIEYAEFTFDIVNNSNINYYIDNIIEGNYDSSKVNYVVTYSDGSEIGDNPVIKANNRKKLSVKVQLLDENYNLINKNFTLVVRVNELTTNEWFIGESWNYSYTGTEGTFEVPYDGNYQLEVWGAQGAADPAGGRGGYGGYAKGVINLTKNQSLYVYVGGQGSGTTAGYNGGGAGQFSGGGATHIATKSGLLSTLSSNIDKIIMVAGGGAGNDTRDIGGNGGGFKGTASSSNTGKGGTQTAGGAGKQYGSFGKGGANTSAGGGGGGFYGGGGSTNSTDYGGGGGSGYIGNPNLTEKVMYCYGCETSDEESTKTISTTNVSGTATTNYAKTGNGYVKITYLGE